MRVLHAGGREEVERRDRLERADDRLLRDDLAPLPHGVALDADDGRPEGRRAVDAGESDELLDLAGPVALHHVVVDLPLHAVGPLLTLLLHLRLDHGAYRLRVLGRHLRRHGHPVLLRDLGDVTQGHGLRDLDDVVLQLGDGRRLEVDEHLAVGEELVDPRLGGVDLVLGKREVDVREARRVDVRELGGGILALELAKAGEELLVDAVRLAVLLRRLPDAVAVGGHHGARVGLEELLAERLQRLRVVHLRDAGVGVVVGTALFHGSGVGRKVPGVRVLEVAVGLLLEQFGHRREL